MREWVLEWRGRDLIQALGNPWAPGSLALAPRPNKQRLMVYINRHSIHNRETINSTNGEGLSC